MNDLFIYSNKLINEVNTKFARYLFDKVNWNNRLIGIIGARGVGKTTLALQHIKLHLANEKYLYVTAEDFYFTQHKLIDLANDFVKLGGKYLIIDEIHKYPDWSRELKLIYDYHSKLYIIFIGSSILDIKKGNADLSRRAIIYAMQGMSFREYLRFFHQIDLKIYDLQEILNNKVDSSSLKHPLPLFNDYLKNGYYPFSKENDFSIRLQQIINQTLEVDIPTFANMNISTGRKLKQLLAIIAASVPFKPNMSKIAEMLSISRNNVTDYLQYIEEAGLINQLKTSTQGVRALGKIEKIYLENTNLIYHLVKNNQNIGNVKETFFFLTS